MFQISKENFCYRKKRVISRTGPIAQNNVHFYSSVHPRLGSKKNVPNFGLLNSYHQISNLSTPKNLKILPRLQKDKEYCQNKIRNLLNIEVDPFKRIKQQNTAQQGRRIFYRSQKKDYFKNLSSSTQNVKMNLNEHSYTSFDDRSDKIMKHFVLSSKGKRPYNQDRYICKNDLYSKIQLKNNLQYRQKYKTNYDLYAIFDGHGGSGCSQFLKDNFQHFLIRSKYIDSSSEEALKQAFQKAEEKFLSTCQNKRVIQTSGSCAVVCLLIQSKIYVANLGDSRALLINKEELLQMTKDHKPNDNHEKMRILRSGGKIYKQQDYQIKHLKVFNQVRITPGNLNVSRTIGDIQVKLKKYGGLPGMISSQPQIKIFETQNYDFLLIASDGLFEAFTNIQIQGLYRKLLNNTSQKLSKQILLNEFANNLLKQAEKKSTDNITIIVVVLNI